MMLATLCSITCLAINVNAKMQLKNGLYFKIFFSSVIMNSNWRT